MTTTKTTIGQGPSCCVVEEKLQRQQTTTETNGRPFLGKKGNGAMRAHKIFRLQRSVCEERLPTKERMEGEWLRSPS